jgi:hypothetical protein
MFIIEVSDDPSHKTKTNLNNSTILLRQNIISPNDLSNRFRSTPAQLFVIEEGE